MTIEDMIEEITSALIDESEYFEKSIQKLSKNTLYILVNCEKQIGTECLISAFNNILKLGSKAIRYNSQEFDE